MKKYQPNYVYNIEHMAQMAQQLVDFSKDFKTLLNQLNGYRSEVVRLQQENKKLRLLLNEREQ